MSPQWVQNLHEVIFLFLHTKHPQFHEITFLGSYLAYELYSKDVVEIVIQADCFATSLESVINVPLRLLFFLLFSMGYGLIPDFIEHIKVVYI